MFGFIYTLSRKRWGVFCYDLDMQHVAIMRQEWHFVDKILSGKKTIESRWYMYRVMPWGKITVGDTIYFKETGKPVTAKARVQKVLSYENLTPNKVSEILTRYGAQIGIEKNVQKDFLKHFRTKKYCLLVFLADPKGVKPFDIDKKGFGAMSAWITVQRVRAIRK